MKRLQALKNERGLTLVELLAVIVILAIVSVIAFVMISQVIENSKKDAAVANALQMINSAKLYEANGLYGDDDTATLTQINDAGFIGDIIDPFSKSKHTPTATDLVYRDGSGGYKVTLGGSANSKCLINDKSEVQLSEDGREACDE